MFYCNALSSLWAAALVLTGMMCSERVTVTTKVIKQPISEQFVCLVPCRVTKKFQECYLLGYAKVPSCFNVSMVIATVYLIVNKESFDSSGDHGQS